MSDGKRFECWAVVELMGHQRIAGKVTEEAIGGAGFIRVDVPEVQRKRYSWEDEGVASQSTTLPAYTRYLSAQAIYAINPTTEEIALAAAAASGSGEPTLFEFKPQTSLPAPSNDDDEPEENANDSLSM